MGDELDYIERQKNRAIAIVLGVKEREVDGYLPDDVSYTLRKVILDQFNDLCTTIQAVAESNVILNQVYLDKLDQILEAIDGN